MKFNELLQKSIMIEEKTANIYSTFAERFSNEKKVVDLWSEMERDELSHVKFFQRLYDRSDEALLNSDVDIMISRQVNGMMAFLEKDHMSKVDNLDDAYELAHELEFYETNCVVKILEMEMIPKKLKSEFLYASLMIHQTRITMFQNNYGNKEWRLSVKAEKLVI